MRQSRPYLKGGHDSSHLQEMTSLDLGLDISDSRLESRLNWFADNEITCIKKISFLGKFGFLKIRP